MDGSWFRGRLQSVTMTVVGVIVIALGAVQGDPFVIVLGVAAALLGLLRAVLTRP